MNASSLCTRILPLLVISSISFNVFAIGNWGTYTATMWDTPSHYFTDEDWNLFDQSLEDTLNHAKDGETKSWSNPKTKANGEFVVLKSVIRQGQTCREVKIAAEAHAIRRVTGIAFCPADEGGWIAIPGHNRKKF